MHFAKTFFPVGLPPENWLACVRAKVASLRHGSVQIVVHDGRVTQVDATEKIRLAPSSPPRR